MRVFVTGSTGFIGRHLVRTLVHEGHQVACLYRSPNRAQALQDLDAELVQGTLEDPAPWAEAVRRAEWVFHLAGTLKAFRAEDFYRVNVQGTESLLRVCAQTDPPPTVVLVSSLAAAGPSPPDRLRSEQDPCQPVSHYGRSKLAAEEAARRWAAQVPLTIVRPPIVFGPEDRDVLEMFRPIARWGVHLVPTWRVPRMSLVHVEDLVQGLLAAAREGKRLQPQPDSSQGIYFLAASEHPGYDQLGRMIGQALGRKRVLVLRVPGAITFLSALGAEAWARVRRQPLIFNLDKAREACAGCWTCDPARAHEQLHWQPGASLQQRLEQTAQWYRQHGWL